MRNLKNITIRKWHSHFANTLKDLLGDDFIVETEIQVGKMPLHIDVVVIKKIHDFSLERKRCGESNCL